MSPSKPIQEEDRKKEPRMKENEIQEKNYAKKKRKGKEKLNHQPHQLETRPHIKVAQKGKSEPEGFRRVPQIAIIDWTR